SGFVVGMRARALPDADARGFVRRAGKLWLIHCILTLAVLAVHELTGRLTAPSVAELGGFGKTLLGVLTLYVQPLDYMNILPMFVVFFSIAPLLVGQLKRARFALCLALSAVLWATSQLYPFWSRYTHPSSWPELGALAAWQFAFVLGVCLGYERDRLKELARGRAPALVWSAAGVVSIIFVLAQLQRTALQRLGLRLPPSSQWLVSKEQLGPVALVYMLGLLFLGYQALAWFERRSPRGLHWFQPLETLGRRSLYSFIVHLPLALLASALYLNDRAGWVQDAAALAALCFVYVCARYRLLGRYIPS
ncbi:MAG TPA: OpgC domain-containing protein, partial [Polyangiaceae bacterium]|nr:OpgC domain-containing protein [Polyangiaceae bacterium]